MVINYDILKDIYDPFRLSKEIYYYLQSVIDKEIAKDEKMDDNLVKGCIDELYQLC